MSDLKPTDKVLDIARKNSVRIIGHQMNKKQTTTSNGIIIAQNKVLVPTHCAVGKKFIEKDGKLYPALNYSVLVQDAELVCLQIIKPELPEPELKIKVIASIGEPVFWESSFRLIKSAIFFGRISSMQMGDDGIVYLFADGKVTHGMSGAGVYNYDGEIVGMMKFFINYDEKRIAGILPASYFSLLMDSPLNKPKK